MVIIVCLYKSSTKYYYIQYWFASICMRLTDAVGHGYLEKGFLTGAGDIHVNVWETNDGDIELNLRTVLKYYC